MQAFIVGNYTGESVVVPDLVPAFASFPLTIISALAVWIGDY